VPAGTLFATMTSPGYLTRETVIQVASASSSVSMDMIANTPPFSLDFYRQFARGGLDAPLALQALKPWTVPPAFFIRTVTQDTGETVTSPIITGITRVILQSVPELTGGRLSARIETGSDDRSVQTGFVIIHFVHDRALIPGQPSGFEVGGLVAGSSTVGGNAGLITLQYDPAIDAQGLYNPLACESFTVVTMDHEIVHAMGFYHTATTFDDFHSGVGCPGGGRPERVRYHAAIAYSRPPGNLDPDRDLSTYYSVNGYRLQAMRLLNDLRTRVIYPYCPTSAPTLIWAPVDQIDSRRYGCGLASVPVAGAGGLVD
jgi:hypothetical protein